MLRQFLELGYSVLLSEVDIVPLQNPFDHLVRDCDVEGMSDGWNDETQYGYDDPFDNPEMGWSRISRSIRVSYLNRCSPCHLPCGCRVAGRVVTLL